MFDAIFVPRGVEERSVRRGLGRRGAEPRVHATGAGASAAAEVDAVLDRSAKRGNGMERALIAGLCGALDPAFKPGDQLVYASIQNAAGATIETDPELSAAIQRAVPSAQTGIRGLDVDRVVTRVSEKEEIAARSGAQAIDMESYALASRLQEAGIPFTVLRCVSDGLRGDLPDLTAAFGSGSIGKRALAWAMFSNPLGAMRLISGGIRGLRSLRHALRGLRP